jgi:cytochrome c-type biogenesis protein CcmH
VILPALLAAVLFVVLVPILWPLLRGAAASRPRVSFDQAVYRDQLRELDRDVARGVLTDAEAQGSRVEIQRRLLAVADAPATADTPGGRARAPVLAVMIGAVVAAGSVVLFDTLNTPLRVDQGAIAQRAEVERLVSRLRERLEADPTSQEGWRLYARTTAALGEWDNALNAYRQAIALGDGSAQTRAGLAEVLVARAQGLVVPEARELFRAVLDQVPDDPMARFYLAVAAAEDGDAQTAISQLQALAADLPADAPVRQELRRRIEGIAAQAGITAPALAAGRAPTDRGPDAEAVEAAGSLPPAERQAMIRAMVDRLADRLRQEPNDFDGWMRLGRSRLVLGEADAAADAYERAALLRPDDVTAPLRAVEALLQGRQASDAVSPRAIAILRGIEARHPNEPAVLWYLGLEAARAGNRDGALAYWRRLRDALPTDHPDTAMVRAAIEALEKR